MKIAIFFFLCWGLCQPMMAQSDTLKSDYKPLYLGVEQDVLPYVLRGFILTAWGGIHRTRLRVSYAQAYTPAFFRPKNIDSERVIAMGLSLEFFLKDKFKGFWFGAGGGAWIQQVRLPNPNGQVVMHPFTSVIFSGGCGYNYYLWKGLYISPWVAIHTRLSGNRPMMLEGIEYKPKLIIPEVSIKLGWRIGW